MEAFLYETLEDKKVRCNLCCHRCVVKAGQRGICAVRENRDGVLHTLVFGKLIARHIDPIEKKPLYHFYPGSTAYSIATPGCNFKCQWCQNWEIAQMPREQGFIAGREITPQQIVKDVIANKSKSIAYTYTEPTIFFEFTHDIAKLAHANGIKNIYVTNGYMTPEMLDFMHPALDAANVDLKAFQDKTYKRYVGSGLQPVLDSLLKMKALGIWIEITTLVIPGINDDYAELREIARFIATQLGPETPWHLSRFFPHYQMSNIPPTPVSTLERALEISKDEGLLYVYLGNVGGESNTHCPHCKQLLIRRRGYRIGETNIEKGKCHHCNTKISGVWH